MIAFAQISARRRGKKTTFAVYLPKLPAWIGCCWPFWACRVWTFSLGHGLSEPRGAGSCLAPGSEGPRRRRPSLWPQRSDGCAPLAPSRMTAGVGSRGQQCLFFES